MTDRTTILVADTAFVPKPTLEAHNMVSVFPMTKGDGARRSTLDELLERSQFQADFFETVLPELVSVWKPFMPEAGEEAQYLLRPFLVTVTSLFVDRYLRFIHRLRQLQNWPVVVAAVEPKSSMQGLDDFNMVSPSWQFNQEIIQRIATGLGYTSLPVFTPNAYPEFPRQYVVPNLLSWPPPNFWGKVVCRLERGYTALGRLFKRTGRIISVGLAYDENHMIRRGLYRPFGLFRHFVGSPQLGLVAKNEELRRNLKIALKPIAKQTLPLLIGKLDPAFDSNHRESIAEIWLKMMVDWFPTGYLEGLKANLEGFRPSFDTNPAAAVMGAQLASDLGLLQCIAARQSCKFVIGVTHSAGHYGYIEDLSSVGQKEYSLYDVMLTFGWTQIDKHLPQCRTLPIPCPKLSEKPLQADYLSRKAMSHPGKRDVLFLSNLFHRFPHISTCGHARVDFIDQITESQEVLMHSLGEAGLSIDHKPYNMRYVDLYPEHYHRLEMAGSSGYRLIESKQKGLSVDLIKTARIVLWDQIGSGVVECFTAGVPTMVYWQRIYSRELPWARELLAELERCGVVHTDPDLLVSELGVYLADPKGWMADRMRVHAIKNFCYMFARTDLNWPTVWKRELAGILTEFNGST
jgi:hypothetical protein